MASRNLSRQMPKITGIIPSKPFFSTIFLYRRICLPLHWLQRTYHPRIFILLSHIATALPLPLVHTEPRPYFDLHSRPIGMSNGWPDMKRSNHGSHTFVWRIRQALDDIAAHTVWARINNEYLPSDSNRQRVIRFKNMRNVSLFCSLCQRS
jgi:hypothetical protein